jgi:hypothetical protein
LVTVYCHSRTITITILVLPNAFLLNCCAQTKLLQSSIFAWQWMLMQWLSMWAKPKVHFETTFRQ